MASAKSFSISLDSPIKAIALNGDGQQVVAAGRNLIRIFNIEDDRFVERENIRFAKRSNLNGACTDIAWNPNDENLLAASTTAGAVYVWNLSAGPGSGQEVIYNEHRRTANRVCFHPKESNLLLSGSQDATAVLCDLRTNQPASVFRCEEPVRDVRFNPHHYFQFSVSLENGNVQLFDCRKSEMCEREFTCHTGPVFQSHFHPQDKSLLATCGRDKCIKVWRMQEEQKNPALDSLIPTIAAIGCLAWRPQRQHYIASTALVTDFSISVWDLRRPFIPFASFEKHTDLVTALTWRDQDPHILLAGSKDGLLSQFHFKDAKRPADKVNPVGLAVSCRGDVSQAVSARIVEGMGRTAPVKLNGPGSAFVPPVKRADEFAVNSVSKLSVVPHDAVKALSMDWFVTCAKEYQLYGRPIVELCNHNATVAEIADREQVALVWRIVGLLFSMADNRAQKSSHATSASRHASGVQREHTHDSGASGDAHIRPHLEKRRLSGRDSNPMTLTLEPVSSNAGDFLFNEQTVFEEVDTPYTAVGMENGPEEDHHWQLPTEGFQVRKELPIRTQSTQMEHRDSTGRSTADLLRNNRDRDRNRSGSLGPEDTWEEALRLGSLVSPWTGQGPGLDFGARVQETIHHHAGCGDLQTAVSLVVVLGERARGMVNEAVLEAWLLDYIELLWRFELFAEANEVQKLCGVVSVAEQNQQSTTVYTSCNLCGKYLSKTGWFCGSCKKLTNNCSICQLPVRGLYVWCQGCNHGGHLQHIQEWFRRSPHCPTGCGHYCEFL